MGKKRRIIKPIMLTQLSSKQRLFLNIVFIEMYHALCNKARAISSFSETNEPQLIPFYNQCYKMKRMLVCLVERVKVFTL